MVNHCSHIFELEHILVFTRRYKQKNPRGMAWKSMQQSFREILSIKPKQSIVESVKVRFNNESSAGLINSDILLQKIPQDNLAIIMILRTGLSRITYITSITML